MFHIKGHRGKSSTFIFMKLVTMLAKISLSRQGSFQYFNFTEHKTKVHISCFASRDIEGQVQTSHLSKQQANRPKYYFRDKVLPILSLYRIQNQILSRKSHSNTSILPNTKSNRLTYHVSHQGTCSNIPFIKLVGIQTKISFSRQRHSSTFILPCTKPNTFQTKSFQYFHFTEYKIKQAYISCFASRDKLNHPIYQTCRHID